MSQTNDSAKPRDHMARVFCTNEAWTAFRRAAQERDIASSAYLGRLVSREVLRLEAAASKDERGIRRRVMATLDEARTLRDDVARLTARLEWLAEHGEPARPGREPTSDRPGTPPDVVTGAPQEADDWSRYRLNSGVGADDVPEWEP